MLLISSPAKAWEEINLQEDKQNVLQNFVYPMIGLCGLSVLLGILFDKGWSGPQSFQFAMTRCCSVAVSLFGGFYLASYLIKQISERWLKHLVVTPQVQKFVGYAMVMPFVLQILIGILPDFMVVAVLLKFYTFYIVWEGCVRVMQVTEEIRFRFTIIASLVLILSPVLISIVFDSLIA